jgi:hypothetical protein
VINNKTLKDAKNLAKLGDGIDESPTVMVGDNKTKQLGKNRGILNPVGLSLRPIFLENSTQPKKAFMA